VEPAVAGDRQCPGADDLVEAGPDHRVGVEPGDVQSRVLVVDAPQSQQRDAEVVGDAAQRVRTKNGRMCSGAGDDADQLDVETEQGVQEGQAVVGRETGEEDRWTAVALRLALRRGQLTSGMEAERRLGPELGRGGVEPGGGGGHAAIVQTAPMWTDGLLPWYARHGRHR